LLFYEKQVEIKYINWRIGIANEINSIISFILNL